MIDKFHGKIHVGDIQILMFHKLIKVVANKIFHLLEGQSGFWIYGLPARCGHALAAC
jgi:hypothetical protein